MHCFILDGDLSYIPEQMAIQEWLSLSIAARITE